MARIAFIDDHVTFAKLLAGPVAEAGHEVHVEIVPLDFERVMRFDPQVIVFGLSRMKAAFNRPIQDVGTDVLGYQAIIQSEKYPALNVIPMMLVGTALEETDLPTRISYDAFLSFPDDIDMYVPLVEELATKVKTRRRISDYQCPVCKSRLTYTRTPLKDMFCPRCHAAIAIVDDERCTYMTAAGQHYTCRLADLAARHP